MLTSMCGYVLMHIELHFCFGEINRINKKCFTCHVYETKSSVIYLYISLISSTNMKQWIKVQIG
jgi:hypothetical protein